MDQNSKATNASFSSLVQMNQTADVKAKDFSDLWNNVTCVLFSVCLFYRKVERKARHDEIRKKYGMYEPLSTLYYCRYSIQPLKWHLSL